MTYKEYIKAMESNTDYFKVSIAEFCLWLDETEKRVETFLSSLEELKKGIINIYDVCIDYSIPMTMVNYFINKEINDIDVRILSIPAWK